MPYVNIRIAGSLSREQKKQIAQEITDTLERVAHKPKSYTYIAFDELPHESWAIAGTLAGRGGLNSHCWQSLSSTPKHFAPVFLPSPVFIA